MTTTTTVTITRRSRCLGYGVTSHVARDGRSIQRPGEQYAGLTARTLLAGRARRIRGVGGNPGGGGVYYREAVFVGGKRIVFDDHTDFGSLLWNLQSLVEGDTDAVTVTVEK